MISMIRLRKARTDDAELVRLIRTELIPLSHTVRPLDAHIIRELPLRFRHGTTYVAALSKTSPPIAFIHFEVMGETLLIYTLATHPEHRNRQWGKKLMAHAEANGMAHQCKAVRLHVDCINTKALHFYAKLGYHIIGCIPAIQCYELHKSLTPALHPSML